MRYLVSDYRKYFDKEIFGPLLHVYVYDKSEIEDIVKFMNESQFGLTLGIHTRIASFHEYLASSLNVGNIYVNRDSNRRSSSNTAVWWVWSKWNRPKAGGPDYLKSMVWEKHVSINTTAIGGNTVLLSK